ncbi:MAG: ComEC/Rec2 family competence protein [Candidatus Bruticola sp.]
MKLMALQLRAVYACLYAWPMWGALGAALGILFKVWPLGGWGTAAFILATCLWSLTTLCSWRLQIMLCCLIAATAALITASLYAPCSYKANQAYFEIMECSYVCGEGEIERIFLSPHRQRMVLRLKSGRPILAESKKTLSASIREGALVKCRGLLLPLGQEADYYRRWKISHVIQLKELHLVKAPQSTFLLKSEALRLIIKKRIDSVYLWYSRGLTAGMFLGNSAYLPIQTKELLRSIGLSHLTAASGFNVSIVAALAAMVVNLMGGSRRSGVYGAIVLCSLYLFTVGWAASLVRAFFMASLALLAIPLGRPVHLIRTLCIVWIFMLMSDPAWIEDIGFQLSFGAVLGIAIWMPVFASILSWLPKFVNQSISLAISVNMFLLPLLITYFEQFPSAFVLANLLIVPALELVFVLTVPTLILADVPYLGKMILMINEWLCLYALKASSALSDWFPVFKATPLSSGKIILYYMALICGRIALNSSVYFSRIHSSSDEKII